MSTPAGLTGYPKFNTATDIPDGPAQDDALGKHFDDMQRPKALISDLPASGNWPGRTLYVQQDKSIRTWDGSGWVITGWTDQPELLVNATGSQSIPGGSTTKVTAWASPAMAEKITFSSGTATVSTSGLYLVTGSVGLAAAGQMFLNRNGTPSANFQGDGSSLTLSARMRLAAADTVEVMCFSASATSLVVSRTQLAIDWLGA